MSMISAIQFAYLPAYAALHSLLVSRQFKSLVWQIFGPSMDSWYVKVFSVFAAITLAPLALLFFLSPGKRLYTIKSPWRWLMVTGQLMASMATVLAFINAPHRFSISQQLRKAENPEPLKPRGIYCFVQDPFLLSGLLQIWLTPFMTSRLLVLYAMTSVYEDYQKEVPRVIPRALKSKK
jgi:protein-S-isoprenylcysteine O-methyltransferase Ste14